MQSISFCVDSDARDLLLAQLWEWNTTGVLEEGDVLTAFFEDEIDISPLRDSNRNVLIDVPAETSPAGAHSTLQTWDPLQVGERFFIVPSWVHDQPPPGRARLVVDAQNAFGSGRHETTQLMISAMEKVLKTGDTVLDIGCGSGILSAVAEMLGAGLVFGCDTSLSALEIAQQHTSRTSLFVGSADSVCAASTNLLLVNISADICDALASELARIIKPDGVLLLSGFIAEKVPQAYKPVETLEQNGWLCCICSLNSIHIASPVHTPVQPFPHQWW